MIDSPQTEAAKVTSWRWKTLLELGLTIEQATRLADRRDVDLHDVRRLIEAGCDTDTAY